MDLARKRNGKLTSVEKANVMHSGILWREVMTALHAAEGDGVELGHMYADNCAMQLVRNPKQFDVIVTDNLFGDLLSDCAAMLTGSLGMLPSASLGAPDPETGCQRQCMSQSTDLRQISRSGYRQSAGTVPEFCNAAALQL